VVGPVFLRGKQMWLIGGLIGTAACVALGLIYIQLPMVLAGVGMLALASVMSLVMPERHMRPTPHAARSTFAHMRETARDGFRLAMARPVVKVIIAISFIVGLAAEAFDRLHVPLVIDRFAFPTVFGMESPLLWFGISGVVGTVLGLAVSEVFQRRNPAALSAGAPARVLAVCASLQVAAVAVFALSGNLWLSFGMLWLRAGVDAVSQPVEAAWLNRHLDAPSRATVISMTGQANSIGQAMGGPALGWVGNAVSIQAALLASALVLSPSIALYRRLKVRDRAVSAPVPFAAD
jgi:DHA3 family tetracycline resistance protein-like MFS transporter